MVTSTRQYPTLTVPTTPLSSSTGTSSTPSHIVPTSSLLSLPNHNPNHPSYTPTLALAILALILYAGALILHSLRLYQYRRYAFSILCILTALFELIGYAFRLRSSPPPVGDPYSVINFVIQYFFIVVAPVFFSAGIYTTLTAIIAALGRKRGPLGLRRRTIIWVFVAADVGTTLAQVAGASLIGASESNNRSPDRGNNILLAGLTVQVASFLAFLVLLGAFLASPDARQKVSLRQFYAALVASSLLVYLRTIFRLAETAGGVGGYASSHEAFFGALEFAPIVVAIILLGWWHPGKWLPRVPRGSATAAEMEMDGVGRG